MRKHGRLLKNISGLLLLLALLALLLPFCRFDAAGQSVTLSGADVISAGARAGYSYIQNGQVPEDLIVKDPFTWGDIRGGLAAASQAGLEKALVFGGTAAALPVLLCFLSMCLLFIAARKKGMLLPTLFTIVTCAELFLAKAVFPVLDNFLEMGCYLFTFLNAAALVLILLGWITGGYRKPPKTDTGTASKPKKEQELSREKNRREDSSDKDKKSTHKKHSDKDSKKDSGKKKKRKKSQNDADKNSRDRQSRQTDKDNATHSGDENSGSAQNQETAKTVSAVSGQLTDGTGLYRGYDLSIKNGQTSVTLGTTPEAVLALHNGSRSGVAQLAEHSCHISYDAASHSYTITSYSKEDICLRNPKTGTGKYLRPGDKVRVTEPAILTVNGAQNSIHLN